MLSELHIKSWLLSLTVAVKHSLFLKWSLSLFRFNIIVSQADEVKKMNLKMKKSVLAEFSIAKHRNQKLSWNNFFFTSFYNLNQIMTIWFTWVCLSVTFALRCTWFPGSNFRHPKLQFSVGLTLGASLHCVFWLTLWRTLPLIPHPSHAWCYFIPLGSSQQIPALMLPQVPDLSLHTDTAPGPTRVRGFSYTSEKSKLLCHIGWYSLT